MPNEKYALAFCKILIPVFVKSPTTKHWVHARQIFCRGGLIGSGEQTCDAFLISKAPDILETMKAKTHTPRATTKKLYTVRSSVTGIPRPLLMPQLVFIAQSKHVKYLQIKQP